MYAEIAISRLRKSTIISSIAHNVLSQERSGLTPYPQGGKEIKNV
jgi:hypothetical protein